MFYWLGFKDEVNEGVWMDQTTGQEATLSNWGPGEPNGGTGENCLVYLTNQLADLNMRNKIADVGCNWSLKTVCVTL